MVLWVHARSRLFGVCVATTCMLSLVVVDAVFTRESDHRVGQGGREREGHYIAIFHPDSDNATRSMHMARHRELVGSDPESDIHQNFRIGERFQGYSGKLSKAFLEKAAAFSAGVVSFEPDVEVSIAVPVREHVVLDPKVQAPEGNIRTDHIHLNPELMSGTKTSVNSSHSVHVDGAAGCTTQSNAVWGLVRTAERDLKLDGKYNYDSDGAGVDAYILDTGVYTEHSEFEGRASFGISFTGEKDKSDKNGHGTHCAGTIGSTTYGVAKAANLIGVQVLGSSGSGYMSWIVSGVNWVCEAHKKNGEGNKCVVNLSLSGGYYNVLNNAVDALVECGCTVAVAAGNDGESACKKSPASATNSITVGASNRNDKRAYFSSIGSCVDLFAPGVYITSTWIGSKYAINTISGTSMASPHVAGVAAKLLSSGEGIDASTDQIKEKILSTASQNKLSNIGTNSPNKLLYAGCSSG